MDRAGRDVSRAPRGAVSICMHVRRWSFGSSVPGEAQTARNGRFGVALTGGREIKKHPAEDGNHGCARAVPTAVPLH